MRDAVEENDVIVVLQVLPQRLKWTRFGSYEVQQKGVNTSKTGNEEKGEEYEHLEGEEHSDDKQANVLLSEARAQASFD